MKMNLENLGLNLTCAYATSSKCFAILKSSFDFCRAVWLQLLI